ncbi:MAG: hypothetical protein ABL936_00475 [Aestuariivirga sp.]
MAVQSPGAAPADTANTETSFEAGLALLDDMDAEDGADDQQAAPVDDGAADPDDNVEDILAEDGVEEEEETDEAKAAKAAEGDVEELKPDATIKLSNGTVVKAADLEAAYNGANETKAETTRILQETASERSNLQILGQNMSRALENISNYLVDQLPPEPDPNLAYTDAAEHYRQTMQRQAAIAELRDVLSVADGSKQAVAMLSDAEFQAVKREEDGKWIAAMPSLKDPKRFQAADKKAKEHALSLGYAQGEVDTTADHRLRKVFFQSARYEEIMAKAGQAKGKVENAPIKMPPAKARTHQNSRQALDQVNAKKRLAKSGTLNDAMKLNFE